MRRDGFLIGILLGCCFLLIAACALTWLRIKEYEHGYQEPSHSVSVSQEAPPSGTEEEASAPTSGEEADPSNAANTTENNQNQ